MAQKSNTAIGLDIGTSSVKCVQISQNQDGLELRRATILPVGNPPRLSEILGVVDLSSEKHIRIAVSGSSVLIRRIKLPAMTLAELKGAIRFEAEGHIPFSIDDCVLDFHILDRPDKSSMNVLLVVAKKDFIQARLKTLEELKIYPEIIDVDIFCLLNVFEVLHDDAAESHKSYGLLNIGHQVSSFVIVQDKFPYFVREIPYAGCHVTRALMEMKGLHEAEAGELKLSRAAEHLAELKTATEKGFELLAEELRHSVDFFENESGEDLKVVWISGGGALSVGAAEVLTSELGRQVSFWDNMKKIHTLGNVDEKYLSEHSTELNVALGMAIRGVGKK